MGKIISKELGLEIAEKYKTHKYTFTDLAEEFNLSKSGVHKYLHRNYPDIITEESVAQKYKFSFNVEYFDIINTEHKAYWLGLLYADGTNSLKSNTIRLRLQEEDKEILEKFNIDINSNRPLSFISGENKIGLNRKDQYQFIISSRELSDKFTKLGCHPNKTFTLKFPTEEQVPAHLLRHFIRGMWDGDGSFTLTRPKKKFKNGERHYLLSTNLVGTKDICENIFNIINKEVNFSPNISGLNNSDKIKIINFGGNQQVYKFIEWLYKESDIWLKRKYDKWQNYKEIMCGLGFIPK